MKTQNLSAARVRSRIEQVSGAENRAERAENEREWVGERTKGVAQKFQMSRKI